MGQITDAVGRIVWEGFGALAMGSVALIMGGLLSGYLLRVIWQIFEETRWPQGVFEVGIYAVLLASMALLGFVLFKLTHMSAKGAWTSAQSVRKDVAHTRELLRQRRERSDDELRGGLSVEVPHGGEGGLSVAKAGAQELELVDEQVTHGFDEAEQDARAGVAAEVS